MNLLERIKKLCNQRGISVYQLEEKIDIGRNTIYQWNKRTPSTDKIQKVADYFDVSVDYLLGRTDDPEPIAELDKGPGSDLIGYFRLNTAEFDPDETEEIEDSLKDYTDFLVQKARERKARENKKKK